MYSLKQVSRREFLKILGMATSATALGACASRIPTLEPVQPTLTENKSMLIPPTLALNDPTEPPPTPTKKPLRGTIYPEMVLVEAGSFQMGSNEGYAHESPVHTVTLTRSFYIGIYAVTYAEYARYCERKVECGADYDDTGRETYPLSHVDWYDAVAYCNWLSNKAGFTPCYVEKGKLTECDFFANGYRLPTEAEWEFAARGGRSYQGFIYSGSNNPDDVGWHAGNSGSEAHPVGQLKPNELGIYDMSGNRWEWCWDWYDKHYYASSPAIDPTGPTKVPGGLFVERSRRSSSAKENELSLRTAYRSRDGDTYPGDNGIRLVRTA